MSSNICKCCDQDNPWFIHLPDASRECLIEYIKHSLHTNSELAYRLEKVYGLSGRFIYRAAAIIYLGPESDVGMEFLGGIIKYV